MKTKLAVLLSSIFVLTGALLFLPSIHAQQAATNAPAKPNIPPSARAPLMRAALEHLELARTALVDAKHDFAGHRAAALKACDEAITEVKAGVKLAEEKP